MLVEKCGHENEIKHRVENLTSLIGEAFSIVDMLFDETQHALWNQVLVKKLPHGRLERGEGGKES